MKKTKPILDVCCGGKMFYFDKNNPLVNFCDVRKEQVNLGGGRILNITPDEILDFRRLPFDDKSFNLVVFDPPHLIRAGEKSWIRKKYGVLEDSWAQDLKQGFCEAWRVLALNGTLVFKWNEYQINRKQILDLFPVCPVFGHRGSKNSTHWYLFFKEE